MVAKCDLQARCPPAPWQTRVWWRQWPAPSYGCLCMIPSLRRWGEVAVEDLVQVVMANCARVVESNVMASQGMVHMVDKVAAR